MDNQTRNQEELQWVDDQLKGLTPPRGWEPDAERAFEHVMSRKSVARSSAYLPLLMAAVLILAIGAVVLTLPWKTVWTFQGKQGTAEVVLPEQDSREAPKPAEPVVGAAVVVPVFPAVHSETTQEAPAQTPPPESPGETPLHVGQNVTEPILISQTQPEYSQEARDAKIQGTVELLIIVREDGGVTFDSVRKSLGYGLDEKAIEAVKQWRFIPGKKDGKAVPTYISVLINFSLRR